VEAYLALANHGHALPYGIYSDETLVGFLMIGYGADDEWENPPEIAKGNYSIWRLMIDRRFQGKGYGKRAVELALEIIRTKPCGDAGYCYLSYEPENRRAKELYRSLGFEETGELDEEELIAVLKL
jgi:Acetyltransferases